MKRLFLITLLALSCQVGLPSKGTLPDGCPAGRPILEAMTYNLGLAPGVEPYSTPRIKPMAEALKQFRDVGVICLQEAWTQEAKDAIVASLALPAENVYYADTAGQGDDLTDISVCKPGQLDAVETCARDNCGDEPVEEQSRCAYKECRSTLVAIYGLFGGGENCLDCLASAVGMSIDDVVATCKPPGHGVTHAYGGQNGQMLISRWPLKNRESVLIPSSIANRAALFATIELEGHESVEVACTHLSTSADVPPSHRGPDGKKMFSSWDDEMNAQMDIVSAKLKERAGSRPQLLLGDLNSGPGLGKSVTPDMPKVWSHIVSLGFTSPAAMAERPYCSVCPENSQRLIDGDHPGSHLIDHVLYRDPLGGSRLIPACTRRLLDSTHEVYYPGYDGRLVEGHLSDHYAVSVGFYYE